MHFLSKMGICHCYVSLPEGNLMNPKKRPNFGWSKLPTQIVVPFEASIAGSFGQQKSGVEKFSPENKENILLSKEKRLFFWERTITSPIQKSLLSRWFSLFPRVGYVSSLEATILLLVQKMSSAIQICFLQQLHKTKLWKQSSLATGIVRLPVLGKLSNATKVRMYSKFGISPSKCMLCLGWCHIRKPPLLWFFAGGSEDHPISYVVSKHG